MATDGDISESPLTIIEDHPEYIIVEDARIPGQNKKNIILKYPGLCVMARYYFQKYHIVIDIEPTYLLLDALAQVICRRLQQTRIQYASFHQIGIILMSKEDQDGVYGHALPMLWQKDQITQQEYLFFLDTCQLLGDASAISLPKQMKRLMPNIQLWSVFGQRQLDYSSCYTDALVTLKDALRVKSFKELAETKIHATLPDITFFYAPEILLKTAQIGSFIEKSHANLKCIMHYHRKKNRDGKPMQVMMPVSLDTFRQKYDIQTISKNGAQKCFGAFTLFKSKKYTEIIEREQADKSRSLT